MSYNNTLQTHNNTLENIINDINELPDSTFIPTGTVELTSNGEFDVYDYETAKVQTTPRVGAFRAVVGEDLSNFIWLIDVSVKREDLFNTFNIPKETNENLNIDLITFSNNSRFYLYANQLSGYYITITYDSPDTPIKNNNSDITSIRLGLQKLAQQNDSIWSATSYAGSDVYDFRTNILAYKFPTNTKITYVNPDYDVQGILNYLYSHTVDVY